MCEVKWTLFGSSDARLTALENSSSYREPTNVQISASGLQGEQPLVDKTK
jgi:hypothetical protein